MFASKARTSRTRSPLEGLLEWCQEVALPIGGLVVFLTLLVAAAWWFMSRAA